MWTVWFSFCTDGIFSQNYKIGAQYLRRALEDAKTEIETDQWLD